MSTILSTRNSPTTEIVTWKLSYQRRLSGSPKIRKPPTQTKPKTQSFPPVPEGAPNIDEIFKSMLCIALVHVPASRRQKYPSTILCKNIHVNWKGKMNLCTERNHKFKNTCPRIAPTKIPSTNLCNNIHVNWKREWTYAPSANTNSKIHVPASRRQKYPSANLCKNIHVNWKRENELMHRAQKYRTGSWKMCTTKIKSWKIGSWN